MRRAIIALAAAAVVTSLAVAVTSRHSGSPVPQQTQAAELALPENDPVVSVAAALSNETYSLGPVRPGRIAGGTTPRTGTASPTSGRGARAMASPNPGTVKTNRTRRTNASQLDFLSDAVFWRLDTNGDGLLTGAELPTALRGAVGKYGGVDFGTFAMFFRSAVQEARTTRAKASGPSLAMASSEKADGAAPRRPVFPPWFEQLDTDRDGQVGMYEWRAAGRDVADFRRMDADGDGLITRREVQTFVSRSGPQGTASMTIAGGSPGGTGGASFATPGQVATRTSTTAASPPRSVADPGPARSRADTLVAHYVGIGSELPVLKSRNGPTASSGASAPAKPSRAATAKPAAPPKTATAPPTTPAPLARTPPPPARPPAPPVPVEVATLPLPPTGSTYWEQCDYQNRLDLLAGERPNVLFLGDSITYWLAAGGATPVWEDYYAPLGALDFGVGGFRTSHVLWQVETGQVARARPRVVVLMIGTNNLSLGQEPEEVAAGIAKIVVEIGTQLPRTRILLLGILPRGASATDPARAEIAKVNSILADWHDGDQVTYLDIGESFLSSDGSISPEVMPDAVHPSLRGYQLYTVAIWPTLMHLLKAP